VIRALEHGKRARRLEPARSDAFQRSDRYDDRSFLLCFPLTMIDRTATIAINCVEGLERNN
jgi:hypothetical protein